MKYIRKIYEQHTSARRRYVSVGIPAALADMVGSLVSLEPKDGGIFLKPLRIDEELISEH